MGEQARESCASVGLIMLRDTNLKPRTTADVRCEAHTVLADATPEHHDWMAGSSITQKNPRTAMRLVMQWLRPYQRIERPYALERVLRARSFQLLGRDGLEQQKSRVGPFALEADALLVAVDERDKIRAVHGFRAFLEGDLKIASHIAALTANNHPLHGTLQLRR